MKCILTNKSSNGSNSSSAEESGWKQGLNIYKQLHVIASAGFDPDDDNIEINKVDLMKYKKFSRKYCKKSKRC